MLVEDPDALVATESKVVPLECRGALAKAMVKPKTTAARARHQQFFF